MLFRLFGEYMKKTVDVAIVLLIVILFGGCLRQNPDRLPRGLSDFQNERLAYKSFDTLIEAINDKDKEKMKSVMSEHMLNEGKNIEAGDGQYYRVIIVKGDNIIEKVKDP